LKQNLVHAGKLKVQEEYAQKEKDLAIMERVQRSAAISNARVSKMKARDGFLDALKTSAKDKLAQRCRKPDEYAKFLQALIVQGLVKIEEDVVEVQCRVEDDALVQQVLQPAVSEFRKRMQEAGHTVNPTVKVSANRLVPGSTVGGVVLVARDNRIVVNQTVEARLDIAYNAVQPSIRAGMFPAVL
jgi:V-type H+-transporting ATPase subunit E